MKENNSPIKDNKYGVNHNDNNGYLSRFLKMRQKFENVEYYNKIQENQLYKNHNNSVTSKNNKFLSNKNLYNNFNRKFNDNKPYNSKFSNTEIPKIFDGVYIQKRINKTEINYSPKENINKNNFEEIIEFQENISNNDFNLNLNESIDYEIPEKSKRIIIL